MLTPVLPRQLELLEQRLNTAWMAIGKPPKLPARAETLLAFRNAYRVFDAALVSGAMNPKQRAYFLLLVSLGEYPSITALQYWASELETLGLEKTLERVGESREFKTLLRSLREVTFEAVPPKTLLMDVSDTVAYPYNSGIQRVVRQLAIEFRKQRREVRLIKFGALGPEWANESDEAKIYGFKAFGSQEYSLSENFDWALKRLLCLPFRLMRSVFSDAGVLVSRTYHRFRENVMIPWAERAGFARAGFRAFESAKPSLKKAVRAARELAASGSALLGQQQRSIPLIWGASLLQAEVPTKSVERIDRYLALGAADACRLVLVVYDLIRLVAPEFYTDSGAGFIDYLKLFRVAGAFLCISETVRVDTQTFLNLVQRESARPPRLGVAHLGADFTRPEEEAVVPGLSGPMILSVGTIEPRKNQVLLLRAARLLYDGGLRFRLQFVGNPGWKSEEFYQELSRLDPKGEFTSIRYSVTDTELDVLYRQCLFSVFCSHLEGFGLPVLESLARKRPVITSNVGSMKEIAETFHGCLQNSPDDLRGLADKMELLLKDEQELQKLRDSIRNVEESTWKRFADLAFASTSLLD